MLYRLHGWLVPTRSDRPELMDVPGLPEPEVADAYRVLQRVNRQFFGTRRVLLRELGLLLEESQPRSEHLSLLDVGSGSGDLPDAARSWLRAHGVEAQVLALDLDPVALALARGAGVAAVRADALRLPLGERAVDVVSAAKFAHHFRGPALHGLLAEMARVARRRVLVLDIRRHWLAYWGFVIWSRVGTRNRLVRYDGPLSVLRGFTSSELSDLGAAVPGYSWTVRSYAGFQLALVGTRH